MLFLRETLNDLLSSHFQANPPHLHSNLRFIQLYRRQSKLISEEAYYFTNLLSAKSFIYDLDAKSLSMDKLEFEESMKAAKSAHQLVPSVSHPTTVSHHLTNARGQFHHSSVSYSNSFRWSCVFISLFSFLLLFLHPIFFLHIVDLLSGLLMYVFRSTKLSFHGCTT